jgi:hypothetical protein
VTATVTEGGSPASNAMVRFVATSGQFKESQQGTPLVADVATDDLGNATATLIPSHVGWGSVTFTASASLDGQQPTQSTTISLVPNGGVAASLTFTCARQNIGAFVTGRLDTIHVLCTATARDKNKNPITNASMQTIAEAGSIDWVADPNGNQQLVYSVAPDEAPPADVDPLGPDGNPVPVCSCDVSRVYDPTACPGEPCWQDVTGVTHNPRDGVVTLIAAVPGGPDFDNLGEPYVDVNDNGKYDPGEPYIDFNGNGHYDAATGAQVQSRLIWTSFRIIWSGEADRTQNAAHRSTIGIGGASPSHSFQLYLHDLNFNALAADGLSGADGIDLQGTCNEGTLTGLPSPGVAMPQLAGVDGYPGILFKSNPGQPDNGAIAAPGNHATYMGATNPAGYGFNFGYTAPGPAVADSCTITAHVSRTYDPGAPGLSPGDNANLTTEAVAVTFTP